MAFLTDEQLLSYNKRGLFPGPEESEQEFSCRANKFLSYSYSMGKEFQTSLQSSEKCFDIRPDWVQMEYNSEGLRPWEAASVEVSPRHFTFRLRKSFLEKQKYLGLYSKTEIVAHEFSHVGRMNFPDSRFEELFAFQTSTKWRQMIGPLFTTTKQSFALVVLTSMSLLGDFLLQETFYAWAFFKLLPIFYLLGLGVKLLFTRRLYKKCLKKLKKIISPEKARYVTYRLTEKEIKLFGKSKADRIKEYVSSQKEIRWKLIQLAYFS